MKTNQTNHEFVNTKNVQNQKNVVIHANNKYQNHDDVIIRKQGVSNQARLSGFKRNQELGQKPSPPGISRANPEMIEYYKEQNYGLVQRQMGSLNHEKIQFTEKRMGSPTHNKNIPKPNQTLFKGLQINIPINITSDRMSTGPYKNLGTGQATLSAQPSTAITIPPFSSGMRQRPGIQPLNMAKLQPIQKRAPSGLQIKISITVAPSQANRYPGSNNSHIIPDLDLVSPSKGLQINIPDIIPPSPYGITCTDPDIYPKHCHNNHPQRRIGSPTHYQKNHPHYQRCHSKGAIGASRGLEINIPLIIPPSIQGRMCSDRNIYNHNSSNQFNNLNSRASSIDNFHRANNNNQLHHSKSEFIQPNPKISCLTQRMPPQASQYRNQAYIHPSTQLNMNPIHSKFPDTQRIHSISTNKPINVNFTSNPVYRNQSPTANHYNQTPAYNASNVINKNMNRPIQHQNQNNISQQNNRPSNLDIRNYQAQAIYYQKGSSNSNYVQNQKNNQDYDINSRIKDYNNYPNTSHNNRPNFPGPNINKRQIQRNRCITIPIIIDQDGNNVRILSDYNTDFRGFQDNQQTRLGLIDPQLQQDPYYLMHNQYTNRANPNTMINQHNYYDNTNRLKKSNSDTNYINHQAQNNLQKSLNNPTYYYANQHIQNNNNYEQGQDQTQQNYQEANNYEQHNNYQQLQNNNTNTYKVKNIIHESQQNGNRNLNIAFNPNIKRRTKNNQQIHNDDKMIQQQYEKRYNSSNNYEANNNTRINSAQNIRDSNQGMNIPRIYSDSTIPNQERNYQYEYAEQYYPSNQHYHHKNVSNHIQIAQKQQNPEQKQAYYLVDSVYDQQPVNGSTKMRQTTDING